jgi:hypothetical protein
MKAVALTELGGPEVLYVISLPAPCAAGVQAFLAGQGTGTGPAIRQAAW